MAALTDDELIAICVEEVDAASGTAAGELADERATAMDYYLGEPYGDEKEERSQVVTRETLDTIESIMPGLMRIYTDAENLCMFEPSDQQDEQAAEQETDRVNHEFWKKNRGFYNIYSFCKDALLSKTGNLKAWWDDGEEPEREEYKGLSEMELGELMSDETVEREVIEVGVGEGGYDITFLTKRKGGKVVIEPVTPEEFGVNRDARSPYAQDARVCWHRVQKTYGELVAAGYDKDKIDQIPEGEPGSTQENLSRRHLDDETDWARVHNRTYWLTEVYIRIDRNGDDVEEVVKATLATGGDIGITNAIPLDIEDVDAMPFFTASPVLMTHKFYGLSIADLVLDLQRIKSTLLRGILDNTYLANNGRTHINDDVNVDDMLTRRPGGVVRHAGKTNPNANMAPEPFSPLPQQTFDLMNYLDEARTDRTGAGNDVPGLDVNSLANVNSGVAAIAYDQARARIELIARILVEVGLKPLLLRVHELLQKNQSKAETFKLRGQWVQVDPSEWRERDDMTVMVGVGIASRERRLVALDKVLARQGDLIQNGGMGTLLMPQHAYQALHDEAEALGLEGGKYYMDPAQAPPKQQEGPSPQDQAIMMSAQAQMGAAQAANDKNKVEALKVQSAERIRVAEMQNNQRELAMKHQIEGLKADRQELSQQRDAASDAVKATLDAEVKARDQEIKQAELRLKDSQEHAKREVDMYRAVLQSGTTLTTEQMKLAGADGAPGYFEEMGTRMQQQLEQQMQEHTAVLIQSSLAAVTDAMRGELGEVKARLIEQDERAVQPRAIKRDKNGLIVSIGGVPVTRDQSGRVESIG